MKLIQFIDYGGRVRVIPAHRVVDIRSPGGVNDNGSVRVMAGSQVIEIAFRDGYTWQQVRDELLLVPEPE